MEHADTADYLFLLLLYFLEVTARFLPEVFRGLRSLWCTSLPATAALPLALTTLALLLLRAARRFICSGLPWYLYSFL